MKNNNSKILKFVVPTVLTIMLAFTFSYGASAKDSKKSELNGAELWGQNCGRCHNYRGPKEFSDYTWETLIPHMRVIANLPGDQARAILKFLQEGNNPPLEPGNGALSSTKAGEAVAKGGLSKGDAARGKDVYSVNCVSCHGISGKGNGPAAASLSPKPRDLTDAQYVDTLSDEHLYKSISEGGASVGKSPMMPAWGTMLKQKEIIDLIAYIRSLSTK